MYVITKTAAWREDVVAASSPADVAQSAQQMQALRALLVPAKAEHSAKITCWAARPLVVARGKCLGLRFEGDKEPQVLVLQRNRREWLDLSQVLGHAQANHWALSGFVRRR